ncbi:hypothetical protein PGT21_011585 [Puccinia graminis f. sp. tritici]|uniref:Uncharacterized protein n=1 Tax=Puccinia graminis f. sp. tritici TaxID=56615 RepID=A0A5B0RFZ4_PUCGR|nr:hypothetical protein PGT21_011585 [Puccinia graminis f. sp. tritici]KAA1124821.1 hypothetical protein PGTUg99_035502 [Puccinia graminis f. sp. tritici]
MLLGKTHHDNRLAAHNARFFGHASSNSPSSKQLVLRLLSHASRTHVKRRLSHHTDATAK